MAQRQRGKFINTEPTADNLRAIWERIHGLDATLTDANALIRAQASTIASLQSTLTATQQTANRAMILASTTTDTPGDGTLPTGSGGGPPPPPPGGSGVCSSESLSTALPDWLRTALTGAGAVDNCWSAALMAAIEADFNAHDFTIYSGISCHISGRIFHQGNHGLWQNCNGHGNAEYNFDFKVDIVVTNPDGSVSWGWVPR